MVSIEKSAPEGKGLQPAAWHGHKALLANKHVGLACLLCALAAASMRSPSAAFNAIGLSTSTCLPPTRAAVDSSQQSGQNTSAFTAACECFQSFLLNALSHPRIGSRQVICWRWALGHECTVQQMKIVWQCSPIICSA